MTGEAAPARDPLASVWAKSPPKGSYEEGESFSQHTGHVLSSLRRRRDRAPDLGRIVGCEALFDIAAWAVLLHDLGKCAPGFQAMVRGGPRYIHRHEALSLVAVGRLDVPEETMELVAAGVGTHHKDAKMLMDSYSNLNADSRAELLSGLSPEMELAWEAWLSGWGTSALVKLGFAPLPPRRALDKREAFRLGMGALSRLYRRLQSQDASHPDALRARAVRGLVVLADHAGSAHERLAQAPSLDSVEAFQKAAASRLSRGLLPHQEKASLSEGHALLVAPTGSGKTEASLLWASRQRSLSVGSPPVFYVLPYRASLNAMRERLPDYGLAPKSIVLQHSTAAAALYGYLLDKPNGYGPKEAARLARCEKNLGALMTAAVRVLTPYQLLRAFFGLKGHEAVLTDAANGVFVLDELHAYDVPRLALILCSVRYLARDLGARILAMSATFPRVLTEALCDALGQEPARIVADRETQEAFVRHTLRVVERDLESEETFAEVAERAQAGEAVLVVVSTVGRAQRVFSALGQRLGAGAVTLLHSRFTGEDRNQKERQLLSRIGTRTRAGGAPAQGTVLVATQVVEVSLDVDFDVLFSDPAPIEALLQRFGRVNRGRRGGLRDVIVHTHHPEEAQKVYSPEVVHAAISVLRPHGGEPVHEQDVQAWVDAAYAPFAAEWSEELAKRMAENETAVIRSNRPLESNPELVQMFEDLFDGAEVVPERMAARYEHLLEEEPLAASTLCVPISSRQRARLQRAGQLVRRGTEASSFEAALLPYDSMRGLDLQVRDDEV